MPHTAPKAVDQKGHLLQLPSLLLLLSLSSVQSCFAHTVTHIRLRLPTHLQLLCFLLLLCQLRAQRNQLLLAALAAQLRRLQLPRLQRQ